MTGSEIKVTENLGSTTFNNALEIKKQKRSKFSNPFQHNVNVMHVFNKLPPPPKWGKNCHFNEGIQLKFALHRLCM